MISPLVCSTFCSFLLLAPNTLLPLSGALRHYSASAATPCSSLRLNLTEQMLPALSLVMVKSCSCIISQLPLQSNPMSRPLSSTWPTEAPAHTQMNHSVVCANRQVWLARGKAHSLQEGSILIWTPVASSLGWQKWLVLVHTVCLCLHVVLSVQWKIYKHSYLLYPIITWLPIHPLFQETAFLFENSYIIHTIRGNVYSPDTGWPSKSLKCFNKCMHSSANVC